MLLTMRSAARRSRRVPTAVLRPGASGPVTSRRRVRARASPDSVREPLLAAAGGNPFYLEQLARSPVSAAVADREGEEVLEVRFPGPGGDHRLTGRGAALANSTYIPRRCPANARRCGGCGRTVPAASWQPRSPRSSDERGAVGDRIDTRSGVARPGEGARRRATSAFSPPAAAPRRLRLGSGDGWRLGGPRPSRRGARGPGRGAGGAGHTTSPSCRRARRSRRRSRCCAKPPSGCSSRRPASAARYLAERAAAAAGRRRPDSRPHRAAADARLRAVRRGPARRGATPCSPRRWSCFRATRGSSARR